MKTKEYMVKKFNTLLLPYYADQPSRSFIHFTRPGPRHIRNKKHALISG